MPQPIQLHGLASFFNTAFSLSGALSVQHSMVSLSAHSTKSGNDMEMTQSLNSWAFPARPFRPALCRNHRFGTDRACPGNVFGEAGLGEEWLSFGALKILTCCWTDASE